MKVTKRELITLLSSALLFLFIIGSGCGDSPGTISGRSILGEFSGGDCSVTICMDGSEEFICNDAFDSCEEDFEECRVISCRPEADELDLVDPPSYSRDIREIDTSVSSSDILADQYGDYYAEQDTGVEYDPSDYGDGWCTEEYNDCYDDGQPVTCKGPFELCAQEFDDCCCGSEVDNVNTAQPEFDSGDAPDCDTSIFVCEKHSISMDGTPTVSKVTCKSSFTECSSLYGECVCGDSSLTDFGAITVGDAGTSSGSVSGTCDFLGDQVPCYMIVEDPKECSKSTHTCKDGDRWLQCEGSMPYCANKYDNRCLCGIENLGYQ